MKTEKEMRESSPPKIEDINTLGEYISGLVNRGHDYGTCVYAMSLAAEAAFRFVAGKLQVTGFQASCADLDFIKRIRGIEGPFKIVDFGHMLYPQYQYHFEKEISQSTADWLKEEAAKQLKASPSAHFNVIKHWKSLADGVVPFGYQIKKEPK